MNHGPFRLPSKNSIVPLRENIKSHLGKLVDGDFITFTFDTAEGSSTYRDIIEESGLRFIDSTGSELVYLKPGRIERWEYAFPIAKIDPALFTPEKKCIDIGGGRKPWPRANVVVDSNDEFAKHVLPGQTFVPGSITQRLPFQDKEFDFATCFHVLEHVNDPVVAAAEISRIAKEGLVEVPHPTKDGMLLFHETDHRWFVLPSQKEGGPLYFSRINSDWWSRLHDPEAIGAAYRNYIGTLNNVGDAAILRNYFARIEADTNIIHRWSGKLEIKVLD